MREKRERERERERERARECVTVDDTFIILKTQTYIIYITFEGKINSGRVAQ